MEIHKPKPVHDWREFLSEIVIIVIGVSIALGAEQAIEALHWHHKVQAVEEAMRWELAEDDLPQAYARVLDDACLQRDLSAARNAASIGADGASFSQLARAYSPPFHSWDSDAHAMLNQSDVGAHMTPRRLQAWAQPYTLMPRLNEYAQREADHLAILHQSRFGQGRLTKADVDEISNAIDALRDDAAFMLRGSRIITGDGRALGITVSDESRDRIWRAARDRRGDCVPNGPPTIAEAARLDGSSNDQPTVRPGEF